MQNWFSKTTWQCDKISSLESFIINKGQLLVLGWWSRSHLIWLLQFISLNNYAKWTLKFRPIKYLLDQPDLKEVHNDRIFPTDELSTWVEHSQDLMLISTVNFLIVTYSGPFLPFNPLYSTVYGESISSSLLLSVGFQFFLSDNRSPLLINLCSSN